MLCQFYTSAYGDLNSRPLRFPIHSGLYVRKNVVPVLVDLQVLVCFVRLGLLRSWSLADSAWLAGVLTLRSGYNRYERQGETICIRLKNSHPVCSPYNI
jgi:hypothetical protein